MDGLSEPRRVVNRNDPGARTPELGSMDTRAMSKENVTGIKNSDTTDESLREQFYDYIADKPAPQRRLDRHRAGGGQ